MYCAVYPASSITDLSAVDAAVTAMELQVQAIKDRLREDTEAIPKAKALSPTFSDFASNSCLLVRFFGILGKILP